MSRLRHLPLALALFACNNEPAGELPEAPPAEVAPVVEPEPEVEEQMLGHFGAAIQALDGVIEGDLDAAKAGFVAVRDVGTDATPEGGADAMTEIRGAAKIGAEAANLTDAAAAVVAIGGACGACHFATGGGPSGDGAPSTPEWTPESPMAQHAWAADQMWLGLLAAKPEIFKKGAETLAVAEHGGKALEGEAQAQFAALEARVHEAAGAAAKAQGEAVMAQYAVVLGTCAECHALTKPRE